MKVTQSIFFVSFLACLQVLTGQFNAMLLSVRVLARLQGFTLIVLDPIPERSNAEDLSVIGRLKKLERLVLEVHVQTNTRSH